jgi:hypothetical protein
LKKQFKNTKRRKSPAFFLDRNLGLRLGALLRSAGFDLITHQEHFGKDAQTISDPGVISECKKLRRALLTADGHLPFTYATEIRDAKIAVVLLSNNHDGPDLWAPRIISAKLDIERELHLRARPFTAHVSIEGRVSYVMRYYRKKTKKKSLSKSDHIELQALTPIIE